MSEVDLIVPGLCAFLLGTCYEYNREPGEITRWALVQSAWPYVWWGGPPRATIHPIISRLSVDTLIGQMSRFRDDDRFKAVGPNSIVLSVTNQTVALQPSTKHTDAEEGEIWFDWAFVDFWKSNYCQSSPRFSPPLHCSSQSFLFFGRYRTTRILHRTWSALVIIGYVLLSQNCGMCFADHCSGQSAEAAILISSLRDVIRQQSGEIELLQKRLKEATMSTGSQVRYYSV